LPAPAAVAFAGSFCCSFKKDSSLSCHMFNFSSATPPESAAVTWQKCNGLCSSMALLPSTAFAAIEQQSNAIVAAVPLCCCDALWMASPSLLQLKPADCHFPFSLLSGIFSSENGCQNAANVPRHCQWMQPKAIPSVLPSAMMLLPSDNIGAVADTC